MASAAYSVQLKNNINQLESNGSNLEQLNRSECEISSLEKTFEEDKLTPNFILIGQRAATTATGLQT